MFSKQAEELLTNAVSKALHGTLDDHERVALYKLALTIAADELYRIEEGAHGTVNVGALLLIQQLGLICDPNVDHSKVAQQIQAFAQRVEAASQDSGAG